MAAPKNSNVKQTIMDVALEIFKQDPDLLTLREISARSHISKGTVYHYYKNKDDIIYDLHEVYLAKLKNDMLLWVDDINKDTSLPRLAMYFISRGADSTNLRLRLVIDGALHSPQLRQKVLERYDEFRAILFDRLQSKVGENARFLSWLLLLILDGVNVQNYIGNPAFDAEVFCRDLEKFFRGIDLAK